MHRPKYINIFYLSKFSLCRRNPRLHEITICYPAIRTLGTHRLNAQEKKAKNNIIDAMTLT